MDISINLSYLHTYTIIYINLYTYINPIYIRTLPNTLYITLYITILIHIHNPIYTYIHNYTYLYIYLYIQYIRIYMYSPSIEPLPVRLKLGLFALCMTIGGLSTFRWEGEIVSSLGSGEGRRIVGPFPGVKVEPSGFLMTLGAVGLELETSRESERAPLFVLSFGVVMDPALVALRRCRGLEWGEELSLLLVWAGPSGSFL